MAELPDAVEKPYSAEATHTTMLLRWKYPFDDGVVIDTFEIAVVQLPDVFIPLAQREEERDRKLAEQGLSADGDAKSAEPNDDADTAAVTQSTGEEKGVPSEQDSADALAMLDIDALEPVIHTTGHRCEYRVTDSVAYTAFRVRVRAHSMVGWGGWGKWSLVTTRGACMARVVGWGGWGLCVYVCVCVCAGGRAWLARCACGVLVWVCSG